MDDDGCAILEPRLQKSFGSYIFWQEAGSRQLFRQIAALFRKAEPCYPRLIGETGIPFDMNLHYSISKVRGRHDYQTQSLMLDIMCSAMERNLVSYTLWNYTPENRAYEVSICRPCQFGINESVGWR